MVIDGTTWSRGTDGLRGLIVIVHLTVVITVTMLKIVIRSVHQPWSGRVSSSILYRVLVGEGEQSVGSSEVTIPDDS
jgi:hypothetical protein